MNQYTSSHSGTVSAEDRHSLSDFLFSGKNRGLRRKVRKIAHGEFGEPLILLGRSGSGKSFLLRCLEGECESRGIPVTRCRTVDVVDYMVECIREGREVRNSTVEKLMNPVVLIDEIEEIRGKSSTQEGLAEIVGILYRAGARVVLAGDGQTADFAPLCEGIRRTSGAGIFRLNRLGKNGRRFLIWRSLRRAGVSIPLGRAEDIARQSDMGVVNGCLKRLIFLSSGESRSRRVKISEERAREILGRLPE